VPALDQGQGQAVRRVAGAGAGLLAPGAPVPSGPWQQACILVCASCCTVALMYCCTVVLLQGGGGGSGRGRWRRRWDGLPPGLCACRRPSRVCCCARTPSRSPRCCSHLYFYLDTNRLNGARAPSPGLDPLGAGWDAHADHAGMPGRDPLRPGHSQAASVRIEMHRN